MYLSEFKNVFVCNAKSICQVSQVPLQSDDLPRFAICPQPSVNISALQNLTGFDRISFNQTSICQTEGCKSLDTFGHFVEENGMESKEVDQFYNYLKFTASEVVHTSSSSSLLSQSNKYITITGGSQCDRPTAELRESRHR